MKPHPKSSWPRAAIAAVFAAMPLWLSGCQHGDLSKRHDARAAAVGREDTLAYETQVRESAARLMHDHPGMTPNEAEAEARARASAGYTLTGPTRAEREQAEAQDKFEDDLAKLDK